MDSQLLAILFVIIALSQGTTLLYFFLFDRKLKRQLDQQLQPQNLDLLHGAMKKSQAMLVEAELEGIKTTSKSALATGKLEDRYAKEIALTAEELQKHFIGEVATLSEALKKHLSELESYARSAQKVSAEQNQAQIEKLYLTFEKELRDTIVKMNKDSLLTVQGEIDKAKGEIVAYKEKRIADVEKEIVALTSDVVKEVLKKEASTSGQSEAIMAAFEKAKAAHFI